ncbi:unnamed protein product [Brassica napus]|uniref:(rape) hypothetical protein n=1 Tax=Brassica napus TaxID=3708 RepID=A0A816P1B0_BRANA|nr:unnamed protein product [Brassica napus]
MRKRGKKWPQVPGHPRSFSEVSIDGKSEVSMQPLQSTTLPLKFTWKMAHQRSIAVKLLLDVFYML